MGGSSSDDKYYIMDLEKASNVSEMIFYHVKTPGI
jgi:hypothetical protein